MDENPNELNIQWKERQRIRTELLYEGQVLGAFVDRVELKNYIKDYYPNLDPFDVEIKYQYLTDANPKFTR
jgi:hypothetical protein